MLHIMQKKYMIYINKIKNQILLLIKYIKDIINLLKGCYHGFKSSIST